MKIVRARSTLMQMVAFFFWITEHIAIIILQQHRAVNYKWNTIICFPEMFEKIREIGHRRRIILRHDNASFKTSIQTKTFLSIQNIELTGHPPYNPDLESNDFFLIPKIKNKFHVLRF
jgi:hypothetical protein